MWRRREEGIVVVALCGGGGRRGEGWSHRVEEEGGRERDGPTVWRRREEGRVVVPLLGPLDPIGIILGEVN